MTSGRLTVALAVASVMIAGTAAVAATPASLHPSSIQTSSGSVTISATSVDSGQEIDYAVAFAGPLHVHGWSHSGRLTGTSQAYLWEAFSGTIPNFDVATSDGRVTGQCGGNPNNTVDEVGGVGVSDLANRHGFVFDCVLSLDGGTPWQVTVDAQTQESTAGPGTTKFTGTYQVTDVETSVAEVDADVTYGDAQLTVFTDSGGGVQWGPLRLSGQTMIGSVRYRGDIVSGVGPYNYGTTIPDMTVSGSNGAQTVSGDCTGAYDDVFGQVTTAIDFTCSLSVDNGPASTVTLRTTYVNGGGRCRGRACWGDDSGYFTTQEP